MTDGRPLGRIAAIGDPHGEAETLSSALDFLATLAPLDAIVCTGDLPAKRDSGDLSAVVALLMRHDVQTIRGNHDRWLSGIRAQYLEMFPEAASGLSASAESFVRELPIERSFETVAGPLRLFHGIAHDDMAGVYAGRRDAEAIAEAVDNFPSLLETRFAIAGHTHKRMVATADLATHGGGPLTWINAGTLLPDGPPSLTLLDFETLTAAIHEPAPAGVWRTTQTHSMTIR